MVNYTLLKPLGQWRPDERITRVRNMALLMLGLYLSGSVYMDRIVSQ